MTLSIALLFTALIVPYQASGQAGQSSTNAENGSSTSTFDVLDILVGEWEGTAVLKHPRDSSRADRIETVSFICTRTLKGTYVECRSSWTRTTDGRVRELITYFNYDEDSAQYQILYLYDNWPGKVNYPLAVDAENRTLTGHDKFMAPGDIPAEERVEWWFSENGDEIRSREFNHFETDPDGFWPLNFEFTLRRKR